MIEIQVLSKKTEKHSNWTVDEYKILSPIPLTSFEKFVGIDPGSANLGICLLYPDDVGLDKAILWQIKLARSDNPITRMIDTRRALHFTLDVYCEFDLAIIENAAYAQGFRQVELAEQRAVMAIWLLDNLKEVEMIAPMTIRKKVFGSGKIKAHEAWQLAGIPKSKQPNDALAALSCAYYGSMS